MTCIRQTPPLPRRCRALYDCDADNDDELSFLKGEIIIVLREEEEEWWVSYFHNTLFYLQVYICVVDPFIRMWNMDNNHQKYDKIATVWNVGISEEDENILEGKENKWRRTLADEQLYIIPTIKKSKMTYFGHMIRRNNIHRLILERPLEGKMCRGRPRVDGKYQRMNGNEIWRPREAGSRSRVMENHDSQPALDDDDTGVHTRLLVDMKRQLLVDIYCPFQNIFLADQAYSAFLSKPRHSEMFF